MTFCRWSKSFGDVCTSVFYSGCSDPVYCDGILSDLLYHSGDLLHVLCLCADAGDLLYDQFGRCLFPRPDTGDQHCASGRRLDDTDHVGNGGSGITGILASILKLNPMFYIVQGYRDAFIYKVWFWERPGMTLYFWAFTLVFWLIGTRLFRQLKDTFCRCSVRDEDRSL